VKLVEVIYDHGSFLIKVNYGKDRIFEAEVDPYTALVMLAFNGKMTR
jgi:hypothetical protein